MSAESILLIEDGDELREVLSSVLTENGLEVRACANALEALDTLTGWRPSVIVLDWYLPLLGGEAFVRRVRADPALASLPILVLTGARRLRTDGIDAVLLKPVDLPELLAVIRRLARGPSSARNGALACAEASP